VVKEMDALKSGYKETYVDGKDMMAIYHRMHSLGWYYVVLGETDELLSAVR
ncbi:MAG: hypothetical protein HN348_33710, partial [Proteobacteria bacterium]|nr:hypothetical protein [Pseudomonadota bacterium]